MQPTHNPPPPGLFLLSSHAPWQPGLEALLEAPTSGGSFGSVYTQQRSALDEYIEAQPFAAIKQLLFDILLGQRQLKSAWNPSLDHGTIM